MKIRLVFLLSCISMLSNAQITGLQGSIASKEYSKEIALYKAKDFVMKKILDSNSEITQFDMDPLAASSSGEITSLVYNCKEQNKEGLLLGFFGLVVNEEGLQYQVYDYKNLPIEKALELIYKIDTLIKKYNGPLTMDAGFNMYFKYDELIILLYNRNATGTIGIRVFWKDFDAEWENVAFKRTLKRFEKYLN